MVKYDPGIIQRFAEILYGRARVIIFIMTLVGFLVGLGVGNALGPQLAESFKNLDLIQVSRWGLAPVGGLLGYIVGNAIAFWYKLRAQLALCQRQIEINTRTEVQSP